MELATPNPSPRSRTPRPTPTKGDLQVLAIYDVVRYGRVPILMFAHATPGHSMYISIYVYIYMYGRFYFVHVRILIRDHGGRRSYNGFQRGWRWGVGSALSSAWKTLPYARKMSSERWEELFVAPGGALPSVGKKELWEEFFEELGRALPRAGRSSSQR